MMSSAQEIHHSSEMGTGHSLRLQRKVLRGCKRPRVTRVTCFMAAGLARAGFSSWLLALPVLHVSQFSSSSARDCFTQHWCSYMHPGHRWLHVASLQARAKHMSTICLTFQLRRWSGPALQSHVGQTLITGVKIGNIVSPCRKLTVETCVRLRREETRCTRQRCFLNDMNRSSI